MKIEKILVHMDSSKATKLFLDKIRQLAQSRHVKVELFYCGYSSELHNTYRFDSKAEQQAIAGFLNSHEEALAKLADSLISEGVQASYDVAWCRDIVEGVVRKSNRMQADLIVTEISQHLTTTSYLLNQGEWQLIAQSSAPVLVVRDSEWAVHPRLAIAVDPFHQCDEPAELDHELVSVGRYLAASLKAEQHIVHCFSTTPQAAIFNEHLTLDYESFHRELRVQHRARLSQLIEQEKLQETVPHLLEGEVHEVLKEMIEANRIDILVLGALARGVVDRLLIGSTVERVIGNTRCDLLLVKQPSFVSPVTG